jgi:hypothetical protein
MAKLLRQSIGVVVIDHDVIRSSLLEDNDLPFDEVAKKAYRLQWAFANAVVAQGLNVIMDSTCNFQEVLDQRSVLAEQHGFAYWYVECKVEDIDMLPHSPGPTPVTTLARRLANRVPHAGVRREASMMTSSMVFAAPCRRCGMTAWTPSPMRTIQPRYHGAGTISQSSGRKTIFAGSSQKLSRTQPTEPA